MQTSLSLFSERKKIVKKKLLSKKEDNYIFSPLFASGRLISFSNLMDKILCQSFFNPSLPKIIEYFCGLGELFSQSPQPSVKSIIIPENLKDKRFGEIFEELLLESVIVLGIYREKNGDENQYEYV
jgi:hypothetical protein